MLTLAALKLAQLAVFPLPLAASVDGTGWRILQLFLILTLVDSPVATGSVAEPCHSDTVPVQFPTSYFPSYEAPVPYIILRNFNNKISYQISV